MALGYVASPDHECCSASPQCVFSILNVGTAGRANTWREPVQISTVALAGIAYSDSLSRPSQEIAEGLMEISLLDALSSLDDWDETRLQGVG